MYTDSLCFIHFHQTNGYVHESAESKVKRLETDKQSLMLQVSVLTEQVEAQAEKLREMEYDVEGKRQKIRSAEEMYQSVSDTVVKVLKFQTLYSIHFCGLHEII